MQQKKSQGKQIKPIKKKYRRIAAGVAGAAIMAASMLPGASAPIAQAATATHTNDPVATEQSIKDQPTTNHAIANAAAAAVRAHAVKPSDNQPPENFKEVLNIKATAYAPGPQDNDQWGSQTHLGTQVRPGIIAVDPHVIPLGSLVYIQYPDGHGNYVVAEDTGGAIKGNRIDVAKWSINESKDFGIQNVKVFVVKTPTDLAESNA